MKTCLIPLLALTLLSAPLAAEKRPLEEPHAVGQLEGSESGDFGLGLAESLLIQGQYSEAEKIALRALELSPDNEQAYFILAKAAISKNELNRAQGYVDRLKAHNDKMSDYHALQGMVSMFKDQPEKAIVSLQRALELGEDYGVPASYMGSYTNTLVLAYHRFEDKERALETALSGIDKYPNEADLYVSASRLYREEGEYEKALAIAERGVRQCPTFPSLYASQALAHRGLGNVDKAESAYQALLRLDPQLARAVRATMDGVVEDTVEYKVRVD